MQDLHVLQNGVPRSGNVWLFYLTRHLLTAAGIPVRQFITGKDISRVLAGADLGIAGVAEVDFIAIQPLRTFYTIMDVFRWPVENLDDYVAATTQVGSHSAWNAASADVYRRFSHVLYIVRDPRDVAVSTSWFAFTPFNRLHRPDHFASPAAYLDARFDGLMQTWVEHVQGHLSRRREQQIHLLFYEALVADLPAQLAGLARHLGVQVTSDDLTAVANANSFSHISARQPFHTHRGGWGAWRSQLSPTQVERAEAIAGPLMAQLGYPGDAVAAAHWSPDALDAH